MRRCRTCVYPDTKPDLYFYETGQCSACANFAKRPQIDWEARNEELIALLDRHGGRVMVPSSAGKDSVAQVMALKALGADVTAVTATTCYLTKIGRMNIDALARHVRTIEVTPDMTVRAKMNKIGLELVGDVAHPEHMAIFTTPFKMAAALGITLIMFGEAPQREYGGPQGSEEAKQLTRRWRSEYAGFLGLRPQDLIGMEGITERDVQDYILPPEDQLEGVGIEAHFLGQYRKWDSRENARVAKAAGMIQVLPCSANWWEFENIDGALISLHDFMMFLKYGMGRAVPQLSVDIRNGLIERDFAMDIVKQRDGLFPDVYVGVTIEEMLDRIGVSKESFLKHCNAFTNFDLFVEKKLEWGMRMTLKEFA